MKVKWLNGIIDKVIYRYKQYKNHRWIEEHKQWLFENYDGLTVEVKDETIVYAGRDDYIDLDNSKRHPAVWYRVPINLEKWGRIYDQQVRYK